MSGGGLVHVVDDAGEHDGLAEVVGPDSAADGATDSGIDETAGSTALELGLDTLADGPAPIGTLEQPVTRRSDRTNSARAANWRLISGPRRMPARDCCSSRPSESTLTGNRVGIPCSCASSPGLLLRAGQVGETVALLDAGEDVRPGPFLKASVAARAWRADPRCSRVVGSGCTQGLPA